MLAVQGLSKRINGVPVLEDVSFSLDVGRTLMVSGPNGSGKTTLLRLLAGIARPSGGSIRLDGTPVHARHPDIRTQIGYAGHEPLLYPDLTGRENLRFHAALHGRPGAADIERALQGWRLLPDAGRPARGYSRGMRQRLGLARALLPRPPLLLLDEPDTGLDRDGRRLLWERLREHAEAGGMAVLTAHDDRLAGIPGAAPAALRRRRLVVGG